MKKNDKLIKKFLDELIEKRNNLIKKEDFTEEEYELRSFKEIIKAINIKLIKEVKTKSKFVDILIALFNLEVSECKRLSKMGIYSLFINEIQYKYKSILNIVYMIYEEQLDKMKKLVINNNTFYINSEGTIILFYQVFQVRLSTLSLKLLTLPDEELKEKILERLEEIGFVRIETLNIIIAEYEELYDYDILNTSPYIKNLKTIQRDMYKNIKKQLNEAAAIDLLGGYYE